MISIFFQNFSGSATMKIFALYIMLLFVLDTNGYLVPGRWYPPSKYGINRFDQNIDPIDASIDLIDFEIPVNQIDMENPTDKIDPGNSIDRYDADAGKSLRPFLTFDDCRILNLQKCATKC